MPVHELNEVEGAEVDPQLTSLPEAREDTPGEGRRGVPAESMGVHPAGSAADLLPAASAHLRNPTRIPFVFEGRDDGGRNTLDDNGVEGGCDSGDDTDAIQFVLDRQAELRGETGLSSVWPK